jgi:hypothetical protein
LEKNGAGSASLLYSEPTKEKKGASTKINRYYEKLKPYYKVRDLNDSTLVFESRFESGNLKRAVKV